MLRTSERIGRLALLLVTGAFSALALSAGPASAQGIETQVEETGQALDEARSSDLHLIAPSHFRQASEQLAEARRRLQRGGNISDIRERLTRARQALSRAREFNDIGHVLLREALAARGAALEAEATRYAPELWQRAEEKIREAGREVEDGDQNEARERAKEARGIYRQAELRSIESNLLGRARDLRERARNREAHERAPRTFSHADSLLRAAETVLTEDRSRQEDAATFAERAAREFQHALLISAAADSLRDRQGGIEAIFLRAEEQLGRVAEALEFPARFHEGLEPATDEILSAIRSLEEDRAGLGDRVASLQQELEGARGRTDSLRERLAELGERQAQTRAELDARRRRAEKLREIRGIFSEEEAQVVTSGDRMIMRLTGLRFPVGSAEIRPENFSLLTKVQRVLREFPDSPVTVRGHTDSRGDEEYNLSLSQRRAIAVREYLLANMAISSGRVEAEGFGESQPIASNDTEEGRAMNRRIDVVLRIPES